ncbi:hypothetical protein CH379_016085 [Leptospira ellisii]|uniref:Uncharacterized protein n=1 Tax=Leptospira ellisii TaxID=2023197 RepID=A0A2N0BAA6_9LEPT|nr:hypothetical protein [Leptospira ellisii]MDV6237152.1 hypothetical protein [Leptospira ellisii]PJZ93436.1 hypothetical protein CH379_07805 [Leptospira ellisii]PKA06314.1 hypothetical protein CH375_00305 [Leptospira ellisii]
MIKVNLNLRATAIRKNSGVHIGSLLLSAGLVFLFQFCSLQDEPGNSWNDALSGIVSSPGKLNALTTHGMFAGYVAPRTGFYSCNQFGGSNPPYSATYHTFVKNASGRAMENVHALCATEDGSLFLAGQGRKSNNTSGTGMIAKLGPNGQVQWLKEIGPYNIRTNQANKIDFVAMERDGDGGLLILGHADGPVDPNLGLDGLAPQRSYAGGANDMLLIALTPGGSVKWWSFFGGPGNDQATGLTITDFQSHLLTGNSDQPIPTNGIVIRPYSGPGPNAVVATVLWTDDDKFGAPMTFLNGSSHGVAKGIDSYFLTGKGPSPEGLSSPAFPPLSGSDDVRIVKLSSELVPVAYTYVGGPGAVFGPGYPMGPGDMELRGISQSAVDDGGVVLAGKIVGGTVVSLDGRTPITQCKPGGFNQPTPVVVKLKADLHAEWLTCLQGSNYVNSDALSVTFSRDAGYLIAGKSYAPIDNIQGINPAIPHSPSAFPETMIVRLDGTGNVNFFAFYGRATNGGSVTNFPYDVANDIVVQTLYGGIAVGGYPGANVPLWAGRAPVSSFVYPSTWTFVANLIPGAAMTSFSALRCNQVPPTPPPIGNETFHGGAQYVPSNMEEVKPSATCALEDGSFLVAGSSKIPVTPESGGIGGYRTGLIQRVARWGTIGDYSGGAVRFLTPNDVLNPNASIEIVDIERDVDGGILIAGNTNVSLALYSLDNVTPIRGYAGGLDMFLIKLAPQGPCTVSGCSLGKIVWWTYVGGAGDDNVVNISRPVEDPQGKYELILAGNVSQNVSLGSTPIRPFTAGSNNILAIKYKVSGGSVGTPLWYTFMNGSVSAMTQNGTDGIYFVGGGPAPAGLTNPVFPPASTNAKDARIVKLNSDGNPLWFAWIGSVDSLAVDTYLESITPSPNGVSGAAVAGRIKFGSLNLLDGKTPILPCQSPPTNNLSLVLEFDSNGHVNWFTCPRAETGLAGKTGITHGDNTYWIAASADHTFSDLEGITPAVSFSGSSRNMMVAQLEADGHARWFAFYGGGAGGMGRSSGGNNAVVQGLYGGPFVAGQGFPLTGWAGWNAVLTGMDNFMIHIVKEQTPRR